MHGRQRANVYTYNYNDLDLIWEGTDFNKELGKAINSKEVSAFTISSSSFLSFTQFFLFSKAALTIPRHSQANTNTRDIHQFSMLNFM